MNTKKENTGNPKSGGRFFELFTETIGWLNIFISPFLIGAAIGLVIYLYTSGGIVLALIPAVTGCIIGIVWATRTWKKKGTMRFLSERMSTPDLADTNDAS
jgi:VIT1/CCC1 family predicted Fe2+/Mn2+ transporter